MAVTAEQLRQETDRTCRGGLHLQQRYAEMNEKMHSILSTARQQGRQPTEAEHSDALAYSEEAQRVGNMSEPSKLARVDFDSVEQPALSGYVDQHGNRLHMLRPNEKLASLPLPDNRQFQPLSIGNAIVGLATGRWDGKRAEKLAMSEGSNAAGGYLVNEVFSKTLLDKARAQTRLIRAGAPTLPWADGDRLVMAKVTADPTFSVVAENTTIPESAITFGQIGFTAHKIATIVRLSRELCEDAANAPALIEDVLAKAFAAELDRLGLVGTRPNGLLNTPGVNATDSIGAIEWADVHNAAVAVRAANFEPSGYICSPTIAGDLDITQATDSGVWLGPPPSLNGVTRHQSGNCPDANMFVGDFSQFVFAIRTDANLEITTAADGAFEKHQLLVKLTFRGDVGVLDANAFQILKGITT